MILTKNSTHLQTIYLETDSFAVDVNRVNGKIAIAIKNQIHIYSPELSNFYNFNFHGRKNLDELKIEWKLEHTITNESDSSDINCLSWSDYTQTSDSDLDTQFLDLPPEFNSKTSCELITGSKESLTMHQLTYVNDNGEKKLRCKLLWFKKQPNPIYKVKFSPNATCIASIGYYDKNVKLWHRIGFTSEFCDFELHYLLHDTYVTDIIWKNYLTLSDPNNQNSKDTSVQITPSNSFILKPVNSIIKNDAKLLSTNSSIYSTPDRETQHNVLYTFTRNSILNVYSTYRLEKGFCIFKSGSLDLFEDNPAKRNANIVKSVAMIDNPYLELGLEKLLDDLEVEHNNVKLDNSLKKQNKLLDLIRSKCELCLVVGSDGVMNIYGFGNLCNPFPTNMSIFKVNKITASGKTYIANIKLAKYCLPSFPRQFFLNSIQINHYSDNLALSLVIHDTFRNTIREVGFSFDEIFQFEKSKLLKDDESIYKSLDVSVGYLKEKFTGHNKSVRKLIRSTDGSSVLSVTRFTRNVLWSPITLSGERTTLTKKSIIITPSPILTAVIWQNGKYVLAITKNKLIVYHCSDFKNESLLATEVCSLDININIEPECAFLLPESTTNQCHLVVILKDRRCESYQFAILETEAGHEKYSLQTCLVDKLPNNDSESNQWHIISAINPVGWDKSIERIGRDVLATVSKNGLVTIYYVTFKHTDDKDQITWHIKDSFKTGIPNCSFISGSSINKMAIVDESKTKLSIWDMKVGVMDYYEEFSNEVVKDLDWTATKYGQGILAVGFKLHSLLFTQLRYDYTNRTASFAKIKKVEIAEETTHEIGDSIWMKDGILVIGAGNQLYLSDKKLDINNDIITNQAIGTLEIVSNDLFHLCSALNGPLPLYHPQFIIQLLLSGRITLIRLILKKLSVVLREIDLGTRTDNNFTLDIVPKEIMDDGNVDKKNAQKKMLESVLQDQVDFSEFNEQCANILLEKLQKLRLPFLTGHQQITLSHTVTIMKDIFLKYLKVLDSNGLNFYLTMKLFTANMSRDTQRNVTNSIRMRDVSFALHSDSKDLLYDIVNEHSGGKIDWLNAKRYLLPFWLGDSTLKLVIEKIAANEFMKYQDENNGRKDPSTCSIFYLTLKKKQVLLGLWKNSIGHNEREKMVKFLSNDFTEKRWKSAALKNAFVLLGKHRYVDAASFFLLADSPKDAVNVIIKQLNDVPLAIAVARCYEGCNNGQSMQTILERQILPEAVGTNDRWKLSWVFWILGDKAHAAQALIKPLHCIKNDISQLLPNYKWPNTDTVVRTSNTEDPVLLVIYDSLRNRNVSYLKAISEVRPEHEFSFVIKAATMYSKMGCDWLALYLVKNWKFSEPNSKKPMLENSGTYKEVEEYTQRKRPGDILSKFMSSPSTSPKTFSKPATSLLDSFIEPASQNTPNPPGNLLDSFMDAPKKPNSVPINLLDSFMDPKAKPESNSTRVASQPKSMLDSFTETPAKASTNGQSSNANMKAVPNMLDGWS